MIKNKENKAEQSLEGAGGYFCCCLGLRIKEVLCCNNTGSCGLPIHWHWTESSSFNYVQYDLIAG